MAAERDVKVESDFSALLDTSASVSDQAASSARVEVKMVVQEPFTEGEGTDIDSEMELCWAPEETVMLGRRDGQR